MNKEIWKPILGYEGLYEVSNKGNVRSMNYNRTGNIKLLKYLVHRDGYLKVRLYKDKSWVDCFIHKLVAINFIPNPYDMTEIDHKNGNKTDNKVENLKWCTRKENMNNTITKNKIRKTMNYKATPVIQYNVKGELINVFDTIMEASRVTGVNSGGISNCCQNKNRQKTAGGYIWKYKKEID